MKILTYYYLHYSLLFNILTRRIIRTKANRSKLITIKQKVYAVVYTAAVYTAVCYSTNMIIYHQNNL